MNATELLAKLGELGVRLEVDGTQLRYHPKSAVDAVLKQQLSDLKSEVVIAVLDGNSTKSLKRPPLVASPTQPICRCGSFNWRDVAIHGGRSTRRDCDQCGRFIGFSRWYENSAFQAAQHAISCKHGKETQAVDRPVASSDR